MVTLGLEDLDARYGKVRVVSGVTVPAIPPCALTAVIGPNGSGKSSFLKRIAGLIKGEGTVDTGDTPRHRDTICYMPQDVGATAVLSVYESVILALKQGATSLRVRCDELARVDAILQALRIVDLASRDLGALSHGQRQLVGIAQTLVREPDIVLMDEPTSALDLHRRMEVLSFIRDYARSRRIIVLVAIHDLNHALRYCDHALALHNGRMVRFGPCPKVIDACLLRDVYRVDGHLEYDSLGYGHIVLGEGSIGLENHLARSDGAVTGRTTVLGNAPPSVEEHAPHHPKIIERHRRRRAQDKRRLPTGRRRGL